MKRAKARFCTQGTLVYVTSSEALARSRSRVVTLMVEGGWGVYLMQIGQKEQKTTLIIVLL